MADRTETTRWVIVTGDPDDPTRGWSEAIFSDEAWVRRAWEAIKPPRRRHHSKRLVRETVVREVVDSIDVEEEIRNG